MSAENLKWRVNRAVRKSNLPSPARLIMFVLSDMADAKTGVIPEKKAPSLKELAEDTGYGESTVKEQLAGLEELGWVFRTRPDAHQQARHVSTGYRLAVGSPGEKKAPAKRKPRAKTETPDGQTGGQEIAPADSQEMAPEIESGGQELTDRGPSPGPSGAISWPPYLKDDDRNDRDDLKKAADAAAFGGGGALFEAPPSRPVVETEGQKVNRLARIFTDRHMANYKAVAGVVRSAVRRTNPDGTRTYTDQQLADGMTKLADDGWTPTLNTLRVAIEGMPRQRRGDHEGFKNPDPSEYHGTF